MTTSPHESNTPKRVLSGLQPSGQLHLGNYAGAIKQFVQLQDDHEMFVFVASYHALTSGRDAQQLRTNIRVVIKPKPEATFASVRVGLVGNNASSAALFKKLREELGITQ